MTQEKRVKKVHLLASVHPQFDEILDNPPEGFEYTKVDRLNKQYHSKFTESRLTLHRRLLKIFPFLPRMTHTKTDADIIHSTRGIIQIFQKKPWIIDLECGTIFTSFNYKAMQNPITRWIIMRALLSKKCKKILPQSYAALKTFEKAIGKKNVDKLRDKIEVLYLTMRPNDKKRVERNDGKVVLSFIGRSFFGKGGHNLITAFKYLQAKYGNLVLKYKGNIPDEYKDFAFRTKGFEYVEEHLSRDELFNTMYLHSDIFVLPTNKDNYGVVLLEAMSVGLPIVSTTSMTVPEIVQHGVNGYLVKTDFSHEKYYNNVEEYEKKRMKVDWNIVDQLVKYLSILIENKDMREAMGNAGRYMIESEKSKLNSEFRNRKLKRIYEECLK